MSKRKFYFMIGGLVAVLVVGAYISIHLGNMRIPFSATTQVLNPFFTGVADGDGETFKTIITEIRLPRILAALLCGLALSIAGTCFQSMFRNPLVSPDLLGVLAGAAFGASIGMLFCNSFVGAQVGAFIFGGLAVALAVILAGFFPGNRLVMLIMGGVISTSLFTSLLSVIKYIADSQNKLPAIVYWLMGGFSSVSYDTLKICGPIVLVCSAVLLLMSGYLNILSMGDDEAKSLGVNVSVVRGVIITLTTLACASTVALGGMIGWVGLMIPHIARMITGPDNRQSLPVSALIGAIYLILVDDLCRCGFGSEVPIGIITSLLGVPFFVFVTWKTGNK